MAVSPILTRDCEDSGGLDMTLADMRAMTAEVVDLLRERGDAKLHYVAGPSLLGRDCLPAGVAFEELMADGVHPNDAAQAVLADNFGRLVVEPALGPPTSI